MRIVPASVLGTQNSKDVQQAYLDFDQANIYSSTSKINNNNNQQNFS